ncbi:MAG: single-stranded-DNA-specific exonuclease RecJ, partial [Chloroflexi bacterium]|nr:single-stranded-DNA-specific exonuclease RecJ [Chloroflexota bacterium]
HDMRTAALRLIHAIDHHEHIAVYGDFDADGITATSLMCDALRQLGGHVAPYIPHRTSEGYGLNNAAIDRLVDSGVRILLTVDCGISNSDEVAHAQARGIDVIITDHHTPPAVIPQAVAVVNPNQAHCPYPDKGLVGVGVAYKVIEAIGVLGKALSNNAMYDLLDLVALGTIADLGPLIGENRSFVHRGLQCMRYSQRPGIQALIRSAGVDPRSLTAEDVGFKLAPRINAAGRLADAEPAYELLLADDIVIASQRAQLLNDLNQTRQQQTRELQERLARDIEAHGYHHDRIIVHADPEAHAGLVGLVAARIADQFARPSVIIEESVALARGSARSGGMINMIEALRNCGATFVKVGGHAAAAGFTIATDQIATLRQRLNDYAQAHHIEVGTRQLAIDCELAAVELDMAVLNDIALLEPCGQRNPQPNILTRDCRVLGVRTIGSDQQHLQLTLEVAGQRVTAMAWGEGTWAPHFTRISHIDIVYQPQLNEWNGKRELRLNVRDFRSARGPLADPQPDVLP